MTTRTAPEADPVTGVLGAEVSGVDIGNVDDATVAERRSLWTEHEVLVTAHVDGALDDLVFFEGNDNAHHGDLDAVRADRAVVTVLFTHAGQTVDTTLQVEPEAQIVGSLVTAVEAAQ